VTNYIPKDVKLRFEECNFPGFYTVFRTARQYPRKIGGNLLGYVGEVNADIIKRDPEYKSGDYIGMSGVEAAYEKELRGKDGVKILERDTHGAIKGSYMDGAFDSLPVPGKRLTCTIDAKLQAFAEELMKDKVGAVVAIEPKTGEILVMASSPTYDPDEMVGRERGNNYMKMLGNKRQPLFNRAVKSKYPPGSTFKLVQGLIGLQEGVLTPEKAYPCHGGYHVGRISQKCHAHYSPLDLRNAVGHSCNAYFCYVFRDIIDNRKYKNVKEGLDVWSEYVKSFGYGRKLDSDFLGEGPGTVPTSELYNKRYRGSWNSLTVLSLSIGQGELGCTPMQMANLACIVANRGYYYIPHIVKGIEGRDSIDQKFYEKQYTKIDPKHFEPIAEGMWRGVNIPGGGTSNKAYLAGYDVCGKTGTAQNPHGRDHSTFLSFAPKDDPKIAISVYVENGGFGATIALPIASLIEEMYLTDTITRPQMVEQVKNMKIYYPHYDRK
jgi:penicillin-binding protein 2